ncbi:MAG: DUF6134 family protein [Alphaproteobacteria bacterium]
MTSRICAKPRPRRAEKGLAVCRVCAVVLAVALGVCALSIGGAPTIAAIGPEARDRTLTWDVFRNGESIGRHRLVLRHDGSGLTIENEIDIRVDLAFITLYRYRHHSSETWRDGALFALSAETDDDGSEYSVQARSTPDGGMTVTGTAGSFNAPAGTEPSSLWQIAMTETSNVLDVESGRLLAVHFKRQADELVETGGAKVPATHVSVTGDLTRDMWYGADGMLLKQQFSARDGSRIEYRLAAD